VFALQIDKVVPNVRCSGWGISGKLGVTAGGWLEKFSSVFEQRPEKLNRASEISMSAFLLKEKRNISLHLHLLGGSKIKFERWQNMLIRGLI
jgi:hypothetical protein